MPQHHAMEVQPGGPKTNYFVAMPRKPVIHRTIERLRLNVSGHSVDFHGIGVTLPASTVTLL